MKKVYERIVDMRGNLLTVRARGVGLGELARIERRSGPALYGSVLRIEGERVTLQVFENTRGISTHDHVVFLGREMRAICSDALFGRRLSGAGVPIDNGPLLVGDEVEIGGPSFNPVRRIIPRELVRTNIPMIDLFNCLVKSQKIPIFSVAGEPYNSLLMRIANQTDADVVIIGGMGLRFDDTLAFIENAERSGSMGKTIMFIHQATDPVVEALLVPDLALACAEKFAIQDKDVLVLLTDMSAFADSIKEIMITMDQVPSNRGYPGSLYSDLAARYEKAVDIDGSGSITIISVTTMPGGDVTHPIPDNTGYITEGQFYLHGGRIDPFGSLSRLKQQVIGKVTREDHNEIANTQIRLYAESKKAKERESMGFKLSNWDAKLLQFSTLFEEKMMNLEVNLPLEEALDLGWKLLARCFAPHEVGMKESLVDKYWPKT
ncbi:MAG TPA: V-type ATP synthase subunit B [Parachlamydiales bacterium]|nr:MAG: V-type ATP synthase subunit B [Chlamydiae bacterium GWA2_50_15]OGN55097.1 MAG: V-type ATP synthase subunit B [Chlamydiae bacterium GWF2_49_8]OGN57756.1 MAG: V-type ATP synthase subunit B [Chlamydiae bacterium RIFCSPHIGHO2_02_FULL_49_29]OGN62621.1 MAG: V-type ATP synthase subunit B [Chlamydiae bacterium RIFCSPHIGHO2_12_FULL_49_32]OGN68231.1 MAG: V-type ATP synthase subunit B [Chlamydiae bacterium RIFCSPLOWO2_02_FULL_49_12]OGN72874.1 MAG: V-type ATP synthase subunit B [Chlamydiae bacteri